MLNWFADKLILGYCYSTIAFLLLIIVHKPSRDKSHKFLNAANLIILFGLVLNLTLIVQQSIDCKTIQLENLQKNNIEGYDFYYSNNCFMPLFRTLILGVIFQSLFAFKKYRSKIWATIISMLLLLTLQFLDRFYIFITSFYKDYIPSSWSVYYYPSEIVWKIVSPIVYFFTCWIIAAKTKNGTVQPLKN